MARRILLSFVMVLTILSAIAGFFLNAKVTHAASYCQVSYSVTNQWPGGFGGSITINNTSSTAWSGWTLAFTFPASGQAVTQGWNGVFTQSGQNVTVVNESWNGNVAASASVNPGFNGSWSASNPVPTSFTVNGNVCDGSTTATPTPTQGTTPTPTQGTTPTPTQGTTPTATPAPGDHVSNPYAGATGYINPDWAAEVQAAATAKGGTLGAQMSKVANNPTAVWLDRIAAVSGGTGVTRTLAGHLDAALDQAAHSSQPIVITIVVYDLPNRDCAAYASNGELSVANNGLATYKSQYIDPIAATLNDAKYSKLRIAAIVEPDSLPNLVTNLSIAKCAEANNSGAYVQGIQYALNKLHAISNVYNYIDIAHSGWLGWSSNFQPAVNLITNVVKGTTAGLSSIDGFISNTANYTPITEPFMTANQQIGNNPVRSANFYQWNQYIDEATYDTDMRNAFINAGFPNTIGMLIDTSRNGWGGANRPAGASPSTDLNTFVNASKVDGRLDRGNWCNQPGGIGVRPTANPAPGFAAYVWVKPPGESDGTSDATQTSPDAEGKQFDTMCDPSANSRYNSAVKTGALPNAPDAGHWFESEFETLVQNANPSL